MPSQPASAPPDLPSSVQIVPGEGGLPLVRVTGSAGSAEVYLHGAHVTAWAPVGQEPVLWLSAASRFTDGAAIRGGVPICFPWFGAKAGHPGAPAHGFARLLDWALVDAREERDDVVLTLGLADSDATRASGWPHPFEARYTVTIGEHLTLALHVTNRGREPVQFEAALHTYLRVRDIRATEVAGLQGAPFIDQLAGPGARPGEHSPIRFDAETDRAYLGTQATTTVHDTGARRTITVAKDASNSTVVWNPWIAKAAAMADFGNDEWTGMLCIETCNIRDDAVALAPGESRTMTAVLSVGG